MCTDFRMGTAFNTSKPSARYDFAHIASRHTVMLCGSCELTLLKSTRRIARICWPLTKWYKRRSNQLAVSGMGKWCWWITSGDQTHNKKYEGKKKGNLLLDDSLSICQKMDALVMRSESARAIRPIQSSFRMIIVIIIVIRLLFIKSNLFTATKRHCELRHCIADNVIASFKWKRDTMRTHIVQLNQTTSARLNRRRWDRKTPMNNQNEW